MKLTRIDTPVFTLELSYYDARCLFALIGGLSGDDVQARINRYNPQIGHEYEIENYPKFETRLYDQFLALGFRSETYK